jgi:hypothetical protein
LTTDDGITALRTALPDTTIIGSNSASRLNQILGHDLPHGLAGKADQQHD